MLFWGAIESAIEAEGEWACLWAHSPVCNGMKIAHAVCMFACQSSVLLSFAFMRNETHQHWEAIKPSILQHMRCDRQGTKVVYFSIYSWWCSLEMSHDHNNCPFAALNCFLLLETRSLNAIRCGERKEGYDKTMTAFKRMYKSELTIEGTSLKGTLCYQGNRLSVAVWFDSARREERNNAWKGLYNTQCRPTDDKLNHATNAPTALFFFASLVRTYPLLFAFLFDGVLRPMPMDAISPFCNKHAGVVPKHCHFNEHIRYLKWVKGESEMKK